MNSPSGPANLPRSGCLGCFAKALIILIVLGIVAIGCGYYTLMHTAIPFKTVAAAIESAGVNENVHIGGVTGSLSTGIGVQSVQWNGGELADIRVSYTGLQDLGRKELIIREIHVGKAHIDIANWNKNKAETNNSGAASTPAPGPKGAPPVDVFQIDRLTFADVLITNSLTGFSLAIPAFEMTGFKAANGKWDFDQMNADSDRLKIVTTKSPSADYQRRVEITLLPKLYPLIRKAIHLTADLNGDPAKTACHLTGFDGKLVFEIHPDKTGSLHCSGLNLADYFNAPLPQNLNLDLSTVAEAGKKNSPVKIGAGSFKLGLRAFQIPPHTFGDNEAANMDHVILAVSRTPENEISYELLPQTVPGSFNGRLISKPPLSPADTVAQVFYGKPYSELQPAEKTSVDQKVPFLSSSTQTPPPLKTAP